MAEMSVFILALALVLIAQGLKLFQEAIPNGANVHRNGMSWPAVGHAASGDNAVVGITNDFAVHFIQAGYEWTVELCELDSDDDGQSNGLELGDPTCIWKKGSIPSHVDDISHPGFADSKTSRDSPFPSSSTTSTPVTTTTTLAAYEFVQQGVAGPFEIWNVGNAKGQGVLACYKAVMASSRCGQDYFTYVARGDRNCGCKGSTGALKVRADTNGDIYRISSSTTRSTTLPVPFQNQVEWNDLLPSYDFIVVGGGAAGTVAAYTLAEQNPLKTVLLVEAGDRQPLDFAEGINGAKPKSEYTSVHNGWRISSLLGGGSVYNGRSFRGIPRWYVQENNLFDDPADVLAFDEAGLWAQDHFAAPAVYPNMQGGKLEEFVKRIPTLNVPSGNLSSFEELVGYGALSYKADNGLASSRDGPGFLYFTTKALLEDKGRRSSGQYLIENFIGKNLGVLIATYVRSINFDTTNLAVGIVTSRGEITLASGGEVVICANVYETPSLLQRSGIGPRAVLEKLAVQPIVNTPHVEAIGAGYWNNVYFNRLLPFFDYAMDFGESLGSPGLHDRVHNFIKRIMYGKESRLRVDANVHGNNGKVGYLDLECSSDMPRGFVEASDTPFRPKGRWPFDADPDEFIRVVLDCVQAYFLDHYWPIHKAKTNSSYAMAVDGFIQAASLQSLKDEVKAHGEPAPESEVPGPRWAEHLPLHSMAKSRWQEIVANGWDRDSIHYGGTCVLGTCVGKSNFTVTGTRNVRIADLSLYGQPTPGNTMAAAYTMARYVAKHVISSKSASLRSPQDFHRKMQTQSEDLTYKKFKGHLQESKYRLLYKADGSNIKSDFIHSPLEDRSFYHNYTEAAMCGIRSGRAGLNLKQLISREEHANFVLDFWVKMEPWMEGGVQIRSDIHQPVIMLGGNDSGNMFDGSGNLQTHQLGNASGIWKLGSWNAVHVVATGSDYYVTINGKLINRASLASERSAMSSFSKRIAFGLHEASSNSPLGGQVCFKHIILKDQDESSCALPCTLGSQSRTCREWTVGVVTAEPSSSFTTALAKVNEDCMNQCSCDEWDFQVLAPTETPPSFFHPVDTDSDVACRGANPDDNSNSYYKLFLGKPSLDSCKAQCMSEVMCKGIEFHEGSGRCEVWIRPEGIGATRSVRGYRCLRYEGPALTTTSSQQPQKIFTPVDDEANRACRGSSQHDNRNSYYTLYPAIASLDACQAQCTSEPLCKGIEFRRGSGRCEVWTRPGGIGATQIVQGYVCLRYSAVTTTTTSAQPLKVFAPVDQERDRACRGASPSDNSISYYSLHSKASLNSCKAQCINESSCKGIEFHSSSGRCEVWTRPGGIGATRSVQGYVCLRYTSDVNASQISMLLTSHSLPGEAAQAVSQRRLRAVRRHRHDHQGLALLQHVSLNGSNRGIAACEL